MRLLTKEIENRFIKVGCQEGKGYDAEVIVKFFDPCGSWTWYATEYDPSTREFFGHVCGFENEWGNFSLDELQSVRNRLGLGLERDMHFGRKTVREALVAERGVQVA